MTAAVRATGPGLRRTWQAGTLALTLGAFVVTIALAPAAGLVPLALIASSAALACLLTPAAFTWPVLGFFAWQFFHFQKQNLGMSALAAAASGAIRMSSVERRAIVVAGLGGIAGLIVGLPASHLHGAALPGRVLWGGEGSDVA